MKDDDDHEYIFVRFVTRNGKKIFASHYGLQAFRIRVRKRKD